MKIVLTALCGAAILLSPTNVFSLDSSTVQNGKELFIQHCALCHGDEAAGQDPDQPAGGWDEGKNRLAPALNGTGHAWHHSPALMYQYIKEGSIDELSPMPAFGDKLGDQEINSVIAYIQSLWPKEIMKQYEERFR